MILGRYFTAVINFFGFPPSLAPEQEVLEPNVPTVHKAADALSFVPPGVGESETPIIECRYPEMEGYEFASGPKNRGKWLKSVFPTPDKPDFDITTNYEKKWPKGVVRHYDLTIAEKSVTLDGVTFPHAKLINGSWPGPWIQACWGDEVHINVTNKLRYNGTAIHMHGIRMLDSNLNDGVPGITQCPIAPNQSFVYNFTATQYGTTWYHSHYSLQYSDGMLGPLTIHGPASANYESAIDPIIIGDHNHRSAFKDYHQEQFADGKKGLTPPKMDSILINGTGSYAGSFPERRFNKHVKPGERKILRLINSSTDSTYIFSIDEHVLEVIGVDLVPIHPYIAKNLTIGIGQRYHVILKTKESKDLNEDEAYWIRTQPAEGCHNFETTPDARQGILWYGSGQKPSLPRSRGYQYNATCRDEKGWRPIVPWYIPKLHKDQKDQMNMPNSSIRLGKWTLPLEHEHDSEETVNNWNIMKGDTAWVSYKEPTVKNLDGPFDDNAAVYHVNASTGYKGWNYMIIIGGNQDNPTNVKGGKLIPAAHPIHLHGHDFALLQQSEYEYQNKSSLKLDYDNPRRRDVVLLPKNGFVVIAFQTDNAGPWVLHCHIAWHASAGLAFQALEEVEEFKDRLKYGTPEWQKVQLNETCKNWKDWQDERKNHFYPTGRFQDDSGI